MQSHVILDTMGHLIGPYQLNMTVALLCGSYVMFFTIASFAIPAKMHVDVRERNGTLQLTGCSHL